MIVHKAAGEPGCLISLVEKGWSAARRLSIAHVRHNGTVLHLVRGRLKKDVRAVLTPYPSMRLRGFMPRTYRFSVWAVLGWAGLTGCRPIVLVDNERAARWVGRCFPYLRQRLVLVEELPDGAPRIAWRGQEVPAGVLVEPGNGH